jgi:hypothetical protein
MEVRTESPSLGNSFAPSRLGVRNHSALSFLFVTFCAFSWPCICISQPFTFDDVEFWIGSGANRAALAIDWFEDDVNLPALVWGYRWDGTATGRDMLSAIAAADPRLFIKLGNSAANPVRLYGLGYDFDHDKEFGACSEFECTEFDDDGFAYSGEIFISATASDIDDLYREGWATGTGFWHYSIPESPGTNPYDDGSWSDIQVGMVTRTLTDGDWDSWAFQLSTTPPFSSNAENPMAAPSPYSPGDFDRDGQVTAADYDAWKSAFGSTDPAADGNRDGVVDAADYTIWRDQFAGRSGASSGFMLFSVPEPSTLVGMLITVFVLSWNRPSRKKETSS